VQVNVRAQILLHLKSITYIPHANLSHSNVTNNKNNASVFHIILH